jgi:signal transduction histidine kinase
VRQLPPPPQITITSRPSQTVDASMLEAIGRAAPLPFFAADGDGVVRAWNDAAAALLGVAAEVAIGQRLAHPQLARLTEAARSAEAVSQVELVWERDAAGEVALLVSAEPLADWVVGFALPLVEGGAAEPLAAGRLAHEFNNVLGAISGFSAMLLGRDGDEVQHRYAREIAEAATRGAALSRSLAGLARRALRR